MRPGPACTAPHPPTGLSGLPLCVELDGTLIHSDSLTEGVLALMTSSRLLPLLLRLPFGGVAAFRQGVAQHAPFDPALLSYNQELLCYLRQQRAEGRSLVLTTAAPLPIAQAVARHLGFFDAVIASEGSHTLKGAAKADALCRRFGRGGFVYAGAARDDMAVWQGAAAAILVDASPALVVQAQRTGPVEAIFTRKQPVLPALLRAVRPHQWVKNLLVFVPIITAHVISEPGAWLAAACSFLAFCAMASAIYLINDLSDLAADRRHPRKRHRPFASGALRPGIGIGVGAVLIGASAMLATFCNILPIVLAYAAMSISYSLKLKEQPLVDVFLLAGLYTIRLFAGGAAIGHSLSLWLLGFSSFLFLSLALLKRVEELTSSHGQEGETLKSRRGYMVSDAAMLQLFGCTSAFAASMVLALFVQREATAEFYALPGLLWAVVPLMLFWQCRLWLSTSRGYMHDDPIIYAARDWVSWVVGLCVLSLLVVARSNPFALF